MIRCDEGNSKTTPGAADAHAELVYRLQAEQENFAVLRNGKRSPSKQHHGTRRDGDAQSVQQSQLRAAGPAHGECKRGSGASRRDNLEFGLVNLRRHREVVRVDGNGVRLIGANRRNEEPPGVIGATDQIIVEIDAHLRKSAGVNHHKAVGDSAAGIDRTTDAAYRARCAGPNATP